MQMKFQNELVIMGIFYLIFSAFCYFFVSESLAYLLAGVGVIMFFILSLTIPTDYQEEIELEFKRGQQVYNFVENFTGTVRNKNLILNAKGEEFYLILAEDGLMKISKAEHLIASSVHGQL